jgi:hypothetical protein
MEASSPAIRTTRRLWLLCLAVALSLVGHGVRADGRVSLYVYLPLDVSPRALAKGLGASLPGVAITVFGRYKDFEKATEIDHPDAVMSLRPVLEARNLRPALQASIGGKSSETYVAMTVGYLRTLSGKPIGAVDLMGRKDTARFFAGFLSVKDPKVIWVTKTEDLLPLLQFQTAEAVLLPKRSVGSLKSKSSLDLTVTDLASFEVGLPALAFTGPGGSAIGDGVRRLPRDLNLLIGVDRWQLE